MSRLLCLVGLHRLEVNSFSKLGGYALLECSRCGKWLSQ